ncbi:hypothetical protein AAFF_G00338450 [Aldrovandia affinis]|uniref:Uncharacterized protein n=1 Tax=Aldrovandia affinis TaxID=143900 RepID=A0AAD7VZY3_9TELE|nr:hypothetical protein AAFF_G00338450 [Aldrovandia affinis]
MTSNLHEHGGKVGLWISHEKTKAMIIGQDQHHPPLSLGEHDIEYVDNFTYLGSNISNTGNVEKDVFNKNWQSCRSVPTAPQHMVVQCHHYGHQATPLHVSGHSNSDLPLRDVDEDSQHHQHVGCLPPMMPQNHLEDLMARPHHQ